MSDPVETLLHVNEGDEVGLLAQYYDFASTYRVTNIEEVTFACPTEGVWRAREIDLASTNSTGRSSSYTLTIAYGAEPPEVGSYGQLVSVERDPERDEDNGQSDDDEETYECDHCRESYKVECSLKRHMFKEHYDESEEQPDGDDRWRELEQKSRGETA